MTHHSFFPVLIFQWSFVLLKTEVQVKFIYTTWGLVSYPGLSTVEGSGYKIALAQGGRLYTKSLLQHFATFIRVLRFASLSFAGGAPFTTGKTHLSILHVSLLLHSQCEVPSYSKACYQ